MKILRDLSYRDYSPFHKGSVITIGNFDGFHLAHQKILHQTIALASQYKLPSVLMTFAPHPSDYFAGQPSKTQLMRLREKWLALQSYSLDYLVCLRFNEQLASMPPIDFVNQVLVDQLNVKAVFVGDDFRFGAARQGDMALLASLGEQYGFHVEEVPAMEVAGRRVSSSAIRKALAQGELRDAEQLLGAPYSLYGPVVYGDQRGRQWGFPTANIPMYREQPPLQGIYAVKVYGPDFVANGVASIGFRPVFKVKKPLLEVHLLDFDRDIYGQHLRVTFLSRLRDELFFDTVEALIAQIQNDITHAKRLFKKNRHW